jgi:RimJ/RimL family protein N-acetyltransferase
MSASIIFQSSRLYARTFMPQQDAPEAFLLYGDEEVTRFLGAAKPSGKFPLTETADTCIAATEQRLVRYAACEGGRGIMALLRKDDHALVGTVLLKRLPNQNFEPTGDWEVGWHLRRSAWGSGYASEAGAAALDYGLRTLLLPQIFAVVDSANMASRKVVERQGMIYLGQTDRYYGETLELFCNSEVSSRSSSLSS